MKSDSSLVACWTEFLRDLCLPRALSPVVRPTSQRTQQLGLQLSPGICSQFKPKLYCKSLHRYICKSLISLGSRIHWNHHLPIDKLYIECTSVHTQGRFRNQPPSQPLGVSGPQFSHSIRGAPELKIRKLSSVIETNLIHNNLNQNRSPELQV